MTTDAITGEPSVAPAQVQRKDPWEGKKWNFKNALWFLISHAVAGLWRFIRITAQMLKNMWSGIWRVTTNRSGFIMKALCLIVLSVGGLVVSAGTFLFMVLLLLLIPLYIVNMILGVPVSIANSAAAILIGIDKTTYPDLSIDPQWMQVLHTEGVATLPEKERGALLVEATIRALEEELNRPYGYIVNDIAGLQWFDNTVNRQERVAFAVGQMLTPLLYRASTLGTNDEPDDDLEAAMNAANFSRKEWGQLGASLLPVGSTEEQFKIVVSRAHAYADRLRSGEAKFNMNPCDLIEMLRVDIDKVIQKTYGQAVDTETDVPFTEIDDQVYALVGSIRPIYYQAVTLRYAFPEMFKDTAMTNLDQAIEAMGKVMGFNPEIVLPGMAHGAGITADHRANIARLVSDVRHRLTEVTQSIPANCHD